MPHSVASPAADTVIISMRSCHSPCHCIAFHRLSQALGLLTKPLIEWARKKLNSPGDEAGQASRRSGQASTARPAMAKRQNSMLSRTRRAVPKNSDAVFYAKNMLPSFMLNGILQLVSMLARLVWRHVDAGLAMLHCGPVCFRTLASLT